MGGRSEVETLKTLIGKTGGGAVETRNEDEGFFACYLLSSLSPRHKTHTYIGFTVNPRRRIRQHNGEITCGAQKTKTKRPWEMILCIYGFPTNVAALQFEWAWQHPTESVAVRKAAASFKSLSGIANKIKLAYTMMSLPAWEGLNLTLNFFSTKYTKHSAGGPRLPEHMKVQVCPMDDLPCYGGSNQNLWGNGDEYDWDDDEECERIGRIDGNVQEEIAYGAAYYSAVNQNGTENTFDEKLGESEKDVLRKPWESITPKDHEVHFKDEEEDIHRNECGRFELGCSAGKPFQVTANHQQTISSCSISGEVEAIDVSTPSPDCRISLCSVKKRRASAAYPQIIDLTRSPIFVQL